MSEDPDPSELTIDLSIEDGEWRRFVPDCRDVVLRAGRAALRHEAIRPRLAACSELSVVLADDHLVRALNHRYRGRDAATNVLSFALVDPEAPASAIAEGCLGDVVLARQTIAREAREQNKAPGDHLAHLVIHGILHLCGMDHEEAAEAARMEALERELLAGLGVADPYAGAGGTPGPLIVATGPAEAAP
jgi:probable rRNA maturation factor